MSFSCEKRENKEFKENKTECLTVDDARNTQMSIELLESSPNEIEENPKLINDAKHNYIYILMNYD